MHHLTLDGTRCYENWKTDGGAQGRIRVSGIHFVTRDWWGATKETRVRLLKQLQAAQTFAWHEDEYLLGDILLSGDVTPPLALPKLWRTHGLHLGTWRRCVERKEPRPNINSYESLHMAALLKDPDFQRLAAKAGEKDPFINRLMRVWKTYFM
jgi:hypothetical protein